MRVRRWFGRVLEVVLLDCVGGLWACNVEILWFRMTLRHGYLMACSMKARQTIDLVLWLSRCLLLLLFLDLRANNSIHVPDGPSV